MTTLRELGEHALIGMLQRRLKPGRELLVGVGDDSAVVRAGGEDWVLTSDPVIEGVHFTLDAGARRIGRKAAGRVLSDVAAMGAEPLWMLVNVEASPEMEGLFLDELYAGVVERLEEFGAAVIGGDVAAGRSLALHVFAVGRLPGGTAVLRSGAAPGHRLFVTGELGGSFSGKQYDFIPRVNEGIWLREGGWAGGMIDVSDGLLSECGHLARASACGIFLDTLAVPVSVAARGAGGERTPLERALGDGEDFELLFSVPDGKCRAFERAWRGRFDLACTCVGRVLDDREGVWIMRDGQLCPAPETGFRHFGAGTTNRLC